MHIYSTNIFRLPVVKKKLRLSRQTYRDLKNKGKFADKITLRAHDSLE